MATATANTRKAKDTTSATASAFAGMSLADLITNGSPDAMKRAEEILAKSGCTNDMATGGSGWLSGIPFGTYSDVVDENGDFVTFTNPKASDPTKIKGRYLKDANGRRVQLYNAMLRLLPEGVGKVVEVKEKSIITFDKVKFGIQAVYDGENRTEYPEGSGNFYASTSHVYKNAKFEQSAPLPVDKREPVAA